MFSSNILNIGLLLTHNGSIVSTYILILPLFWISFSESLYSCKEHVRKCIHVHE